MKQASLSATRSLRLALDTRLLPGSSRTSSGSGVPNLSSVYANHDDTSSLTYRLSGRLNSNAAGSPTVPQPGGSRVLSTRAKKRRSKLTEPKKVEATSNALREPVVKAKISRATTSVQWNAVGAALSSLEESIARTNLLLHSLASGSAWARRTRPLPPRVKWGEKEQLDPTDKQKNLASAQTTEALAALLQELGQKQAAAVNLLSRLNEATDPPQSTTTIANKTFEDVLVKNAITGLSEVSGNTQTSYESGWGPNGESATARFLGSLRQTLSQRWRHRQAKNPNLPPMQRSNRHLPEKLTIWLLMHQARYSKEALIPMLWPWNASSIAYLDTHTY